LPEFRTCGVLESFDSELKPIKRKNPKKKLRGQRLSGIALRLDEGGEGRGEDWRVAGEEQEKSCIWQIFGLQFPSNWLIVHTSGRSELTSPHMATPPPSLQLKRHEKENQIHILSLYQFVVERRSAHHGGGEEEGVRSWGRSKEEMRRKWGRSEEEKRRKRGGVEEEAKRWVESLVVRRWGKSQWQIDRSRRGSREEVKWRW
jgi:hypothetical protein